MMKTKLCVLLFAGSLAVACNSQLTKEDALPVIRRAYSYPQVLDHEIHCADPTNATQVVAAGLEGNGMVMVKKPGQLPANSPLITFTSDAIPYLMPATPAEKTQQIQKVKLADIELDDVTQVITNSDGKTAVVEFATSYKNKTPFIALAEGKDFNKKEQHKALLIKQKDGWHVEKKL